MNKMKTKMSLFPYLFLIAVFMIAPMCAQETVGIDWDRVEQISKTTPTLQLVENPKVRPSSSIHKEIFKALKDLNADFVRYVPWFPYPKMAVAELKAPTKNETFWNFTYLDCTMNAFMEATKGHPVVINFSTTPAWMWKTDSIVEYPENPYEPTWTYNQGTELRDSTMKELTGYYTRLFSWYTKGGFTDELGKFHDSGHFYNIPYWEVLNEPDLEHNISPELYTKMYDAIVLELKKISPKTKFVGISTAHVSNPEFFEYFLNPKNHKGEISLEGISYHFYSTPSYSNQSIENFQYTAFEKADCFIDKVKYIENIKKRLAPEVFTMINEIGIILRRPTESGPIPNEFWNLAGSMYAHIFLELSKIGIDVAGESQLVGYPTQFPDVSMVNWDTGTPNARYWVLKLLKDNFGPGDQLVYTSISGSVIDAQAFLTKRGKRILLINKKNKDVKILLPSEIKNGIIYSVDTSTHESEAKKYSLNSNSITLKPFSVSVIEL